MKLVFKHIWKGIRNYIPDILYLEIIYFRNFHSFLDLINPNGFNEKLQWLKLYDRNPNYTKMVDKYEVRNYINEKIGEEYLIPLLGVWNSFDEINFDQLPNQFVLKCTHDSGSVFICKDKNSLDYKILKRKINSALACNYYYLGREWPYKNVKPRIIAEKYMVDESNFELKDYKIFCFDGEPKVMQVDYGRFSDHKRNYYDLNWNLVDMSIQYPNDKSYAIKKPDNFDEMLKLSRILSENIPHVRVDWYSINGKTYFGELTFFHEGGFGKIEPREYDKLLGEWINLERVNNQ